MSLAEIGIIFLLALVVLGPEHLPEVARTAARALREARRAADLLRSALMDADAPRSTGPYAAALGTGDTALARKESAGEATGDEAVGSDAHTAGGAP